MHTENKYMTKICVWMWQKRRKSETPADVSCSRSPQNLKLVWVIFLGSPCVHSAPQFFEKSFKIKLNYCHVVIERRSVTDCGPLGTVALVQATAGVHLNWMFHPLSSQHSFGVCLVPVAHVSVADVHLLFYLVGQPIWWAGGKWQFTCADMLSQTACG